MAARTVMFMPPRMGRLDWVPSTSALAMRVRMPCSNGDGDCGGRGACLSTPGMATRGRLPSPTAQQG